LIVKIGTESLVVRRCQNPKKLTESLYMCLSMWAGEGWMRGVKTPYQITMKFCTGDGSPTSSPMPDLVTIG